MIAALFGQGVLIGFGIAMPVGAIGLLVIQRSLAGGFGLGLLTGLGAAAADTLYGAMGGFGVGMVSAALINWSWAFRLFGGLFLIWLGYRAWTAPPATVAARPPHRGGAFLSTFFLTLANPATVLSFAAIFSGIAPTGLDAGGAAALVAGIGIGSSLWWLVLAFSVSRFRHAVGPRTMRIIDRVSGAILIGFALYALAGLIPR